MKNKIYHGDCLEVMSKIKDKSIDMILTDLPFEMTENHWDKIIPFSPMWEQILRITKDNAAIVLMSAGLFTAELITSNKRLYRYSLVWRTKEKRNFFNANKMPLRQHIDIPVFYKKLPVYNPQMTEGHEPINAYNGHWTGSNYGKDTSIFSTRSGATNRYPTTIIDIDYKHICSDERIHPTQKPVELYEWLIKTYTNECGTVLDFAAGSCTLAEACINTNRDYICIEKEKNYWEKAIRRIDTRCGKGMQLKII